MDLKLKYLIPFVHIKYFKRVYFSAKRKGAIKGIVLPVTTSWCMQSQTDTMKQPDFYQYKRTKLTAL